MPPPLPPPPAEASVGMSAAAPMAAKVATAKIVLRIMGLSWFLLDVLSTSCLSVGRAIRRVQWRLDRKTSARPSGQGKPRIRSPAAVFFGPDGAGAPPLVAV